MKKLKMFICMAMAAALLCQTTTTVWAAVTHKDGCNNTTATYADCGRLLDTPVVSQHTMVVNGTTVQCNVVAEIHMHNLLCANSSCRVLMESDVARICTREHTYCDVSIATDICKKEY